MIKAKESTLEARALQCKNVMGKRVFDVMLAKKTNLALSADVTTSSALLDLADSLGPYICILKTHIDIISDFSQTLVSKLQILAKKHNFLIFEDRKFADIGNTVRHQYEGGIYRIVEWADIINAHIIPGPGIIEGLSAVGLPHGKGLLLLAQMSSQDALTSQDYATSAARMAKQYRDFVMGFISRSSVSDDISMLHMTPGVQLNVGHDTLGQQYITPEQAIAQGNDIIIVGRGIIEAQDPIATALHYRTRAFNALLHRI